MARVTRVKKARVSKYTRRCDYSGCGRVIEPGDGMKYISPRLPGSLGSVTRYRCDGHPDWHVWEYSTSLSARIAEIQHDGANTIRMMYEDTAEDIPNELAEMVRELASEKRESAENVESGFGHSTQLSEELNQQADELDAWADQIEAVDALEGKPDEEDKHRCRDDWPVSYEAALESWLEDLRNTLQDVLDGCPL